jgi:branched-chain amino acid transport system ATP-binding protein
MTRADQPAASTAPAALEITNVVAGYGPITVLRGVSLVVPAGTLVALLGPNGAGKTTLLRTVSGLLPATRGSVSLHGHDVTRTKAYERFARGLCHIPEGRGIFRRLTVRENLLMQSLKGGEQAAVDHAVSAFPILGQRLDQQAGTLSGGQQQMLAMAAAYTRDPKLILVDEASLGLAPVIVDEIFDFLEQRSRAGVALLVVDQFVMRALSISATAYVLARGKIVHVGPATELLADTELFDRYVGRADASAEAVPARPDSRETP